MSRMTERNLNNIKSRFTEQTGVELNVSSARPVRKLILLAAAVICCFAMAAFTYPLFTPLDGDELALRGTYEGDGIVSVYVGNASDKDLEFQKQARLMRWDTGEELPRLAGDVRFENTAFPARSDGTMTIDLSQAYDIGALEQEAGGRPSYYLLLTNNGFLFGHDWMCSISFGTEEDTPVEGKPHISAQAERLEKIEEVLRPYFQDSYYDEVFAWEEAHFEYLQKVDELIMRFGGTVVHPVYPSIQVSGPSTMLDPQPQLRTDNVEGAYAEWTNLDGYHRLIGGAALEKALTVMAGLPSSGGAQSFTVIPLRYLFVYEAESAVTEKYAFVYGQLYSFEELQDRQVFRDEHYAIYDVTELLYTDLDAYIRFLQETRTDITIDEKARERICSVWEYYRDPENLSKALGYLTAE